MPVTATETLGDPKSSLPNPIAEVDCRPALDNAPNGLFMNIPENLITLFDIPVGIDRDREPGQYTGPVEIPALVGVIPDDILLFDFWEKVDPYRESLLPDVIHEVHEGFQFVFVQYQEILLTLQLVGQKSQMLEGDAADREFFKEVDDFFQPQYIFVVDDAVDGY